MNPCTASGKGWSCDRAAFRHGLCYGHHRQARNSKPLTPLRTRGGGLVVFPVRVALGVAKCASANPEGARKALKTWADSESRGAPQPGRPS